LATESGQVLNGGSGNAFIGTSWGDGTITTGASDNVVAFDYGSGQDTIVASPGGSNVLSLGEINVETMSFSKNGNDLVLSAPEEGDSITFQNWYANTANQDFTVLQAIDSGDYNPQGSDTLHQNITEDFNFGQLVSQFNAALQSDPTLSSWQLSNGLTNAWLAGSDTQAWGGDLAYYYSENYNELSGMNVSAAQAVLQDPQYALGLQTIHSWGDISGGTVHL
jgi:trimeric autotransporter adhesin